MKARFTFLLAVVSLLLSCDRVPLTSPTGSTISLAVTQTSVPINGSIQVTAVPVCTAVPPAPITAAMT